MNIPKLSIERPVFVSCLIAMILILGGLAYRNLGVDQFPDVNFPYVVVMTTYEGAGPAEVETNVSKPIEDQLSTLEGLKKITSASQDSFSMVICEFTMETTSREAEQRVRDRMALVKPYLPEDVKDPIVQRFDPADMPIGVLSFECPLPPDKAYDLAKDVAKPRLSRVPGVAVVEVYGSAQREIQVELDRDRLNAARISAGMVAAKIGANSQNIPVGKFDKDGRSLIFRTLGEYRDLERIRKTVVSFWGSDVAVPVERLGVVKDTIKDVNFHGYINGNEAIYLIVFKQSKTNTIKVVDKLNEEIARMNKDHASGADSFKIINVYDTSKGVRISLADVKMTILEGIALTVLVVMLFLGSLRTTVITISSLPVSIAGAFILMGAMGFTLNVITLLALSLSVGLLVDDAIVVRENIWRHIEKGEDPKTAALKGTLEVAMAVIATTCVILAVFGPIGFLTGMVGQFFRQLGFTVCFAMVVSLFEAMTMGPMLSAYWAPKHFEHDKIRNRLFRAFEVFQEKMTAWYERAIRWSLDGHLGVLPWKSRAADGTGEAVRSVPFLGWFGWRVRAAGGSSRLEVPHRFVVLAMAFAVFMASLATLPFLRFTFMPDIDQGEFQITVKARPGTSIDAMSAHVREMDALIRRHPEVLRVTSFAGNPQTMESYKGQFYISLVDIKKRKRTTEEIKDILRKELESYKETLQPQIANIDPVGGEEAPFNLILNGNDLEVLTPLVDELVGKFKDIKGLADITTNNDGGLPEYQVKLDPDRMKEYGVSGVDAGQELRAQVAGLTPAKFRVGGSEYDIRVRLRKEQQDLEGQFSRIRVPNQNFQLVRLSDIAEGRKTEGPAKINRRNRARYIMISAQLAKGGAMGNVKRETEKIMKAMKLPPGVTYEYVGQAEELGSLVTSVVIAIIASILFSFLVLASLYESPVTPLTILIAVPMAWVGAFVALFVSGQALNIFSMIGLVMLNGLVTKNSILLVDYILQGQRRGLSRAEAIVEAGKIRLRPILMTTIALIAGMVPLAFALTEAGRFRQSLGTAIVGGLVSSLFLTLLVVPAAYGYVDDLRLWFRKVFRTDEASARAEGKPTN
jgi:HAE1 family hydrophobic/amphiphilic exporter-1